MIQVNGMTIKPVIRVLIGFHGRRAAELEEGNSIGIQLGFFGIDQFANADLLL